MTAASMTWSEKVTATIVSIGKAVERNAARIETLENENVELQDAIFDLTAKVETAHDDALREVNRLWEHNRKEAKR